MGQPWVLRKLMPPVRTWVGLMSHSLYRMRWRGNALCLAGLHFWYEVLQSFLQADPVGWNQLIRCYLFLNASTVMECLQQRGCMNSDVVCLLNSSECPGMLLFLETWWLMRFFDGCLPATGASTSKKELLWSLNGRSHWLPMKKSTQLKLLNSRLSSASSCQRDGRRLFQWVCISGTFLWKIAKPSCFLCSFSSMLCVLSVGDLVSMVCGLSNT